MYEYLQFGFPVNLDYNLFTYVEEAVNHPSALEKKEGVDKYFQEELGYGAIVGPFNSKPFEKLHISPLMVRAKPDGGTRVIVDLSWPRHCSVNSCVPTIFFDFIESQLKYPTIDNLIGKIREMGPRALMFKVDLQRAFRNLQMDPADYSVLGLQWRNQTYVDVATAFGFRQGAASCQLCTDAVSYLMHTQNVWVMAYLDDIIGIALPDTADGTFLTLKKLLENLGLPINYKKVTSPSSQIICLGININAITGVLSIPDEKLQKIKSLCGSWAVKQKATRVQRQKLLGHLLYIHKCIPPARLFTNRILAVLRGSPKIGHIALNEAFHRDIAWFNQFLESFNGSVKIHDYDSINNVVYVDASLVAMGAIFNRKVYTLQIPQILKTLYSIVHFEAVNILVMLRTWGKYMKNQRCTVYCDRNLGVWFDSDFSFSCHVRKVCKACFAHVRDLKRLRGHLTHESTLMAANALVGSRLDYCNSLFRGLSALDLCKLQCVQNSLARIVANTTKYSHITPVRKALHWLPIKYRSIFKTAMLVYKFLHSGNPKYFEPFLIPRHSAYNTRRSQSDGIFLEVPHFGSIFKSRKHFGLSFDLE